MTWMVSLQRGPPRLIEPIHGHHAQSLAMIKPANQGDGAFLPDPPPNSGIKSLRFANSHTGAQNHTSQIQTLPLTTTSVPSQVTRLHSYFSRLNLSRLGATMVAPSVVAT